MKRLKKIIIFYLIFKLVSTSFFLSLSYKDVKTGVNNIGFKNFIVLLLQNREKTIVTQPAKVIKVIDGNTLLVEALFKREKPYKIKLLDVKVSNKENKNATIYLKETVLGKVVFVEKDNKGKTIGYIWIKAPLKAKIKSIDDNMLNAKMIKEGYAKLNTNSDNKKYMSLITDSLANSK